MHQSLELTSSETLRLSLTSRRPGANVPLIVFRDVIRNTVPECADRNDEKYTILWGKNRRRVMRAACVSGRLREKIVLLVSGIRDSLSDVLVAARYARICGAHCVCVFSHHTHFDERDLRMIRRHIDVFVVANMPLGGSAVLTAGVKMVCLRKPEPFVERDSHPILHARAR